jgi:hypothetical protein
MTRTLSKTLLTAGALALLAGWQARTAAPKFFADDPIRREPDSQNAAGVQPWRVDLAVDLLWNLFGHPGDRATNVRAMNVNTVDEVPDGSWFVNRLGARDLSTDEIARGPDTGSGPAEGMWTVVSAKSDGVTPGFTIRDSANTLWFLKFDPPGHRGMTTGTEVAVTKLVWALGYHVPENHITRVVRQNLQMREGATFQPQGRARRTMELGDVDDLLEIVERDPDGSFRAVASRALPGTPLGPFRFYGTRPDDPNDVVPHEHRRELRGFAVFSAWLNHVDAKSGNSLDTLVEDGARSLVRHHLIDFGSTLGSGSVAPRHYWEGSEYMVETGSVGRRMFGLGFPLKPWHTSRFIETPEVGRLPADHSTWDPESWRPRVPNAAFLQARADDRFWAALKLAPMSEALIAAAAESARFEDPKSAGIITRALVERRDAILKAYLPAVNPIVKPVLEDGVLRFSNAAVDARVASPPGGYRAVWQRFDNATGEVASIGETSATGPELKAPADLPSSDGSFLRVDVAATGAPRSEWEKPAHLYFRRSGRGWTLVGLYRLGDETESSSERLRFGSVGGSTGSPGSIVSPISSADSGSVLAGI